MIVRATFARLAASTLFLLLCASASAQPRYGLSADAYATFSKWMTSSCLGDEAAALEADLRRFSVELAPAFRRAMADGPPPGELRAVRSAAEARHADLSTVKLAEYRIEGISPQRAARSVTSVTRQRYAADQAQRYATGYRSNAISGLAIVGGPEARGVLRRMAGQRDALAPAAREALKTMDRQ